MAAAARQTDPIEHESLFAQIGEVGASLLTGVAVGFAFAAAAAFVVGTGGAGALILGAVVATGMQFGADKLAHAAGIPGPSDLPGLASNLAGNALDNVFPGTITGNIVQGSPDVFINKLPAARAIGGEADDNRVICQRHTPVQHVAEGSQTVFINDWPAHRVGDHIDCGAKTSKGSSDVFVGGPPVQTREVASGMPKWLEYVSQFAGIALALCTRNWKSIPGKLLCLAIPMAVSALTDWALKSVFGNPVHAPTGAKFLDGTDDLDFELPATLPLRWVRTYNSMDTADGPLGPGWRLPIGVTLTVSGDRFTLTDQKGIEIPFGEVAAGHATHNISYGWTLGRVQSGLCIAQDPYGVYYDFGPWREGSDLPLQGLEDRSGNRIELQYDDAGRLTALTDSAGRTYACDYDPVHVRRIAMVTCVNGAGGRLPLVGYTYDSTGRLASVTNRAGEVVRRFSWHREGPGRGLMASQMLPSGLVCHYEWTEMALPGAHPRVVRHWTSAGEEWNAVYRVRADGSLGITTVTDHLGRVQTWEWTGPFQITSYTDALGRTWRWTFNDAGLPLTCTEPDGAVWSHAYDGRGNLVQAVNPMGGTYSTAWQPEFDLPESETAPDGATTRYEYDGKGNLMAVVHPGGRVEYRRNSRGELTARRDESGRESTWEMRPDGQAASYTDCSGKVTRWAYDSEGRLAAETDAAGHVTRFAWDEAGRIQSRQTPDGIEERWRWRPGGYLASRERAGARTQYTWDRSGRLTRTVDLAGNAVERQYDRAGRLAVLIDGAGQETRFDYDAADGLIAETGIDGLRTEYRRDVRGFPVEVVQAAGTSAAVRLTLERDLMSRLVAKRALESLTRYTYDLAGRVIAVKRFAPDGVTPVDEVGFTYDAAGRLTEETAAVHRVARHGAGSMGRWQWVELPEPRRTAIRHQRDALGNIAVTTLPHGPDIRYLRYGSGHLLQINLGATVVAEMTRDDLHREVERSQGALEARFGLDPMGRRLSYRTRLPEDRAPDAPGTAEAGVPSGAMAKEYRYDAQGLLSYRRDGWQGARRFEYDMAGRITAHTFGFGGHPGRRDEEFRWDGASNMLSLDRSLRVISGETVQNRVMRWNDNVYTYDTHGRLIGKRTASGGGISFSWNSEHQMVQSWSERGGAWTYHYDALGRRIAKERHGEDGSVAVATWFTWDGMRMVQEEPSPGQCITTVYEEAGSYVPLARAEHAAGARAVRPEQVFHFHTDVNGVPEELTTHTGQTAWRARYQTWGNLALEEWSAAEQDAPILQCRVQNLRFQGQYHDAETGLHYNTFRYYDPDIGRFLCQDPIGLEGGLNLYQYAPDPISWIDPWGLEDVTVYHYTDESGYKAISSQKPFDFRAASPGSGHPTGVYVTPMSPEALNADGPGAFKKRLGITNEKSQYFFEFKIDKSELKKLPGGRGAHVWYIPNDVKIDRDKTTRHGKCP